MQPSAARAAVALVLVVAASLPILSQLLLAAVLKLLPDATVAVAVPALAVLLLELELKAVVEGTNMRMAVAGAETVEETYSAEPTLALAHTLRLVDMVYVLVADTSVLVVLPLLLLVADSSMDPCMDRRFVL